MDDFPVNQIPGMKDGNSGSVGKTGRNHVIILSDAYGIGIGIIAVENRIRVFLRTVHGTSGLIFFTNTDNMMISFHGKMSMKTGREQ